MTDNTLIQLASVPEDAKEMDLVGNFVAIYDFGEDKVRARYLEKVEFRKLPERKDISPKWILKIGPEFYAGVNLYDIATGKFIRVDDEGTYNRTVRCSVEYAEIDEQAHFYLTEYASSGPPKYVGYVAFSQERLIHERLLDSICFVTDRSAYAYAPIQLYS